MRVVPLFRTGSFSVAMSYSCFEACRAVRCHNHPIGGPAGVGMPRPPNIRLPFMDCVSLLLKLSSRFYFAMFVLKNGAGAGHIRLILGGFCT